jgi:hypothetical protein
MVLSVGVDTIPLDAGHGERLEESIEASHGYFASLPGSLHFFGPSIR